MFKYKFNHGLNYEKPVKNKNINILICEDDSINKLLLSKTLNNMGINSVKSFDTCDNLYNYLQNSKNTKDYNKNKTIIITDIKMPDNIMQGNELCRLLRKENTKCNIIASTGFRTKTYDIESYIEEGFNDVLFKPYSRNELAEVLNNNI